MVNEKSTKKQILDAYQASLSTIKQLKAGQLDPRAEKARAKKAEVVDATEPEKVKGALEELGEAVKDTQEVMAVIESKFNKVSELEEAIKFQKEELNDLYGIAAEAETLAALIETKQKVKEDLEESIEAVRRGWGEEKAEQAKQSVIEAKDAEAERTRRAQEWEYDFARTVKQKKYALEDELTLRKKEFQAGMDEIAKQEAERCEELNKREAAVTEREEKMAELEETIEKLKAETDQRVMEAGQAARDKAKVSYNIEVNAIKKGHEAEVSILEGKNASLRDQVENLRAAEASLSTKLNEAYAKIQDVALKSLESQGNSRMVEMSRSMASEQRPSKN